LAKALEHGVKHQEGFHPLLKMLTGGSTPSPPP